MSDGGFMDRYKVDFENVEKQLNAKKIYKLASVQDRIEKVGFGVVRFVDDSNKVSLWQIIKGDDGNEYIEAMYDEEPEIIEKNAWTIETDKNVKTATIFYKNTPVKKIAFGELGIPAKEVGDFIRHTSERLSNDISLVRKMLGTLDENYRNVIVKRFPEIE